MRRFISSVAFEVDWVEPSWQIGWSVVVRGQAHPLLIPKSSSASVTFRCCRGPKETRRTSCASKPRRSQAGACSREGMGLVATTVSPRVAPTSVRCRPEPKETWPVAGRTTTFR